MASDDDFNARAAQARKGSPFLTTAQAAFYMGLSYETLMKMRRKRCGPAFRRHARCIRYHIADLDAWSAATNPRTAGTTDRRADEDVGHPRG